MQMGKLKIGFEITDNYQIEAFRQFLRKLQNTPTIFHPNLTEAELYLISNDDSSAYIYTTGNNIGLDDDHIVVTNFVADKITAIEGRNIDIYLDNLYSTVLSIDNDTETWAILVDSRQDYYYMQPKWITEFVYTLKTLLDGQEETSC
jgi:hypothetical protein